MPTAPKQVTIALFPVAVAGGLARHGRPNPRLAEDAFAVQHTFLQVELAEAGNVLGLDPQAPTNDGNALRALLPAAAIYPQALKEARLEVIDDMVTRRLL